MAAESSGYSHLMLVAGCDGYKTMLYYTNAMATTSPDQLSECQPILTIIRLRLRFYCFLFQSCIIKRIRISTRTAMALIMLVKGQKRAFYQSSCNFHQFSKEIRRFQFLQKSQSILPLKSFACPSKTQFFKNTKKKLKLLDSRK